MTYCKINLCVTETKRQFATETSEWCEDLGTRNLRLGNRRFFVEFLCNPPFASSSPRCVFSAHYMHLQGSVVTLRIIATADRKVSDDCQHVVTPNGEVLNRFDLLSSKNSTPSMIQFYLYHDNEHNQCT